MPEGKILVYIFFIAFFIISRLLRKKNEDAQERPHVPPPTQEPPVQSPPPYKKEKTFLETVMEEVERQKKLNNPKQHEVKQKTQKVERKSKTRKPAEFIPSQWGGVEQTEPIDHLEKEEGTSSIPEKYKRSVMIEEPEPEKKFEFDPREAFMMKTLFERPYS